MCSSDLGVFIKGQATKAPDAFCWVGYNSAVEQEVTPLACLPVHNPVEVEPSTLIQVGVLRPNILRIGSSLSQ